MALEHTAIRALLTASFAISLPSLPCRGQAPAPKGSRVLEDHFVLWPLVNANFDLDLRNTVAQEYPTRLAFLELMETKLHAALSRHQAQNKPLPSELRSFLATPEGEAYRDLSGLITQARAEAQNRDAIADLTPLIERIAALPMLKEVHYLFVPWGLTGGRGISSASSSTWMVLGPVGPAGPRGAWVPTGGGGASSTVYLRVLVLDLKTKTVAMEGRVSASTSSSFMKATALHELEEELGPKLLSAILNPS